jgi:hypothetical protein
MQRLGQFENVRRTGVAIQFSGLRKGGTFARQEPGDILVGE